MTDSGARCLPDLEKSFSIPEAIYKAIASRPKALAQIAEFPELYLRVRIGYIDEMKRTNKDFDRRLNNFLKKMKRVKCLETGTVMGGSVKKQGKANRVRNPLKNTDSLSTA